MCIPSPSRPPAPPVPAAPASQINANSTNLREKAPKAPQTNTNTKVSYSKKRGKAALRIPLQVGGTSTSSGANVPTP